MQQQEEEYRISVLLCYTYRITAEDAQEVCFVAASNRHQVTNERPEDHVISCRSLYLHVLFVTLPP